MSELTAVIAKASSPDLGVATVMELVDTEKFDSSLTDNSLKSSLERSFSIFANKYDTVIDTENIVYQTVDIIVDDVIADPTSIINRATGEWIKL